MNDLDHLVPIARELLDTLDQLKASGYADEELMQKARTLHARLASAYERIGYGTGPIHTEQIPPYLWWPAWREKVANTLAMIEGEHPKLRQVKETAVQDEGYDIAQVCRNGHMVNSSSNRTPQFNQDHCDRCGSPTVTACERCGEPIRGHYWGRGLQLTEDEPPRFCHKCGSPYPWTEAGIEAARELAREAENLNKDERGLLEQSLDDVIRDSPRTGLAAERIKRLLTKASKGTAQAIRDILVDIASETAKRSLGL
jgi:hypothetical protein